MLAEQVGAGLLSLLLLGSACTQDQGPTQEDAAKFFGLQDGLTLTYELTGGTAVSSATHSFKSNSTFSDERAFMREERDQANILRETVFLGAEVADLVLLRSGDCLPECKDFGTPPVLLK